MRTVIRRKTADQIDKERLLKKAVEMLKILHRAKVIEVNGKHVVTLDAADATEWDAKVAVKAGKQTAKT